LWLQKQNLSKKMTDYAVYQITCGHTDTEAGFETAVANFLIELRKKSGVSVTVNTIVHSVSIYTTKTLDAVTEPAAFVVVSINPNHNPSDGVPAHREARPFVAELAEMLREKYDQHVVPFSALSTADSVGAAQRPRPASAQSD
jgi:hypothetical protein